MPCGTGIGVRHCPTHAAQAASRGATSSASLWPTSDCVFARSDASQTFRHENSGEQSRAFDATNARRKRSVKCAIVQGAVRPGGQGFDIDMGAIFEARQRRVLFHCCQSGEEIGQKAVH